MDETRVTLGNRSSLNDLLPKVIDHLKKFGLNAKPLEPLGGGAQIKERQNGQDEFSKGVIN